MQSADTRQRPHPRIRRTGAALVALLLLGSGAAFSQEGRGGGDRSDRGDRGVARQGQESRGERQSPREDRGARAPREGQRDGQRNTQRSQERTPERAERRDPGRGDLRSDDQRGNHALPRAAYQNRIERPVPQASHQGGRYGHHAYRPSRGTVVQRLPRDVHVHHYHGRPYYRSSGAWYRPSGAYFSVVGPPIGAFITVLPWGYTVIDYGGRPYYRYDDVYYARRDDGYVVVEPPEGRYADSEPAGSDELFVYPAAGQSAEQQATDRFECHDWASSQTGYDPTRLSGGVPPEDAASARVAYLRATTACLEARNYTVR